MKYPPRLTQQQKLAIIAQKKRPTVKRGLAKDADTGYMIKDATTGRLILIEV